MQLYLPMNCFSRSLNCCQDSPTFALSSFELFLARSRNIPQLGPGVLFRIDSTENITFAVIPSKCSGAFWRVGDLVNKAILYII